MKTKRRDGNTARPRDKRILGRLLFRGAGVGRKWLRRRIAEEKGLKQAFENIAPQERQVLINVAEDFKIEPQTNKQAVALKGLHQVRREGFQIRKAGVY